MGSISNSIFVCMVLSEFYTLPGVVTPGGKLIVKYVFHDDISYLL